MASITSFLTADHRLADDLFAAAAAAAAKEAWPECERNLALFRRALESHMKIEEDTLFPAFEQATGMTTGPTAVMRSEHRQMLEMLDGMNTACEAKDAARHGALSASFLEVLNAHSAKEENILYPMCDRVLPAATAEQIEQTLQALRADRA